MLIQVVFSCNNIICNLNDNMFDTIDSEKRFTISEHFFFCSFAFASAVRSQKLATFITIFPRHRWIWHDTLSLDTKLTVVKQVQKEWHNCIQCAVNVLYSEDVHGWFGVSVVSGFFRCHCHIHILPSLHINQSNMNKWYVRKKSISWRRDRKMALIIFFFHFSHDTFIQLTSII